MVPAAIILTIVGLALCGMVLILWMERNSATAKVAAATEEFTRAARAMQFEVERLQQWTKMPRDFRGGPSDFTREV
jgi:hypothetical protein